MQKVFTPVNKMKSAEIQDGDTFLTFSDKILYLGEACRCEACDQLSTVNGGRVEATAPEHLLHGVPFVNPEDVVVEDIGCNDDGIALCSKCSALRPAELKAKLDQKANNKKPFLPVDMPYLLLKHALKLQVETGIIHPAYEQAGKDPLKMARAQGFKGRKEEILADYLAWFDATYQKRA